MRKEPVFEIVNGKPLPRVPAVPDSQMLSIEQTSKATGIPAAELLNRWAAAYGERLEMGPKMLEDSDGEFFLVKLPTRSADALRKVASTVNVSPEYQASCLLIMAIEEL